MRYQIEYWDRAKHEWAVWQTFDTKEEAIAYKQILDLNCRTRLRRLE